MNQKITKFIYWTITINLLIAFLMFSALTNFDFRGTFKFINDAFLNFIIGILGLYFIGKIVGKNLWRFKSKTKKFNIFHGILAIFLVLFFGTIIGSTVGFLQEGLPNQHYEYNLGEEVYDYFFKPLYWILLFGFLPTLISGIFLGNVLRKLSE